MPSPSSETSSFCGRTRREFLWEIGGGFGGVALAGLLGADGFLTRQAVAANGRTPFVNPMAPKAPPRRAKAKSVIFLFMYGGPSHVDTFDYKPNLYPIDGKTIAVKTFGRGGEEERGTSGRAEVGVPTVWSVGQDDLRPFPEFGPMR